MSKELELWQFIATRLERGENVVLLVVAESSGSSPGRQGYKMAVGADGELIGSIGGGVMEVNLVEQCRKILAEPAALDRTTAPILIEQEHRRNAEHPSGMICSGRQTVICVQLTRTDLQSVQVVLSDLKKGNAPWVVISETEFKSATDETEPQNSPLPSFEREGEIFNYCDNLAPKNYLYIVGGGHCSLALSQIMSGLDFNIRVLDDRPDLNTTRRNEYANVKILENYDLIEHQILEGLNTYVVIMTLGYESDATVIRRLIRRDFKYFGVLGSKAKMATLMKELKSEGLPAEKLDRIHTPIGLPINSRTPEEIAVSIAAEIISVKNAANS